MPEETMLGGAVRQLRNEKGLSQDDLAKRCEVSKMTISRWEREGVPEERVTQLADALGVSVATLRDRAADHLAGSYVGSAEEMSSWRDAVAGSSAVDEYARLILMALPLFLDRTSWVVSVTLDEFLQKTHLNPPRVEEHWDEVIRSSFVERVGSAKWVLRLRFPDVG